MIMTKITKDEEQFIKDNVPGNTTIEIARLFNERFNQDIKPSQVKYIKLKFKLRSGVNSKFIKGIKPHNYKPVGSEFIDSNGYIRIKVADPDTWVMKQRYVYESVHGKIPKGYHVIFANQDKTDFSIDNLVLVRNKDILVAKNKHLIFEDKDLTKSGLLVAKLINEVHRRKNDRKR